MDGLYCRGNGRALDGLYCRGSGRALDGLYCRESELTFSSVFYFVTTTTQRVWKLTFNDSDDLLQGGVIRNFQSNAPSPDNIAVTRDGRYLYICSDGSGSDQILRIDAANEADQVGLVRCSHARSCLLQLQDRRVLGSSTRPMCLVQDFSQWLCRVRPISFC